VENGLRGSPEEKALEVLFDKKLNMTRQCVPAAQRPYGQPYPGLHQEKHGQQVQEGDSVPHRTIMVGKDL